MAKTDHKNVLRDWAKFFSGFVVCDLVTAIWFVSTDLLPYTILGFEFTESFANFGIAFDVFLLIILIHYAWHPNILEPDFSRRALFIFVGIVTGIVAAVHIARLAFGLSFSLGSWEIPMWLSWIGAFITAFISYSSFHFIKR